MDTKKRVLFITEVVTFPVNGGEKIRSYGLLKLLMELGYHVTAIIGEPEKNSITFPLFKNLTLIPFNFRALKSKNRYVNYFRLFSKNQKLIDVIDPIVNSQKIDFVFIDYFYNGQYITYFQKKGIPVIYGTHNVQSHLILHKPAKSLKNRIVNRVEYWLHNLHERFYFGRSNALIAVSENDKRYYDKYINPSKVFTIPNFLVNEDYQGNHKNPANYIVMSANYYAYPNYVGLKWFINDIWDKHLCTKTKLVVIGHGSKEAYEKIRAEVKKDNIEVLGLVDDLKPIISNAAASIVPLLHGSGSRLKCIEAMALKTPLISTTKGAEGIEHENSIYIADDAVHFRESLHNVLDGKLKLTENAYKIFENKYSLNANIPVFKQLLHSIGRGDLT